MVLVSLDTLVMVMVYVRVRVQ